MGNYYLTRDYKFKHINDAGSKARLDIEQIMDNMNIHSAGEPHTISKNKISHFIRTLLIVMRILTRVSKNDILIIQYPTKYYEMACFFAHLRRCHVITFIHDLGCFRQKHHSISQEINRLNKSDAIICCNPVIENWIRTNGYTGYNKKEVLVSLHAFDFLSKSKCPNRKKTWPTKRVVYAGQLARRKNSFLYEFGKQIHNFTVNVYGKGFNQSNAANPEKFVLKGFMQPNTLISCAEGDFGLVWDGDSIDCCNGNWGEYLLVNTPHKVSLYIRCGLPIIIWRKAAMAGFIEENGIGVCIDSLREINDIYKNLTQTEYNTMCDNVKHISELMSEGHYFSKAVSKSILRIQQI